MFFPEKREFFLENQGLFAFGGVAANSSPTDVPIMFYSRRIGLSDGRPVPIVAGGRTTGRIGRYSLGLLNIQTGEDPGARSTNFSVVRLRRDLLKRSNIGLLLTGRSVGQSGAGSNGLYGIDSTFGFFDNLNINTYWARSQTTGRSGRDVSFRGQLDLQGDRYGAQLEHLVVGDNFNPEVGFLRRDDIRRSFGLLRFSPRPKSIRSVRKFSGTALDGVRGGRHGPSPDARVERGIRHRVPEQRPRSASTSPTPTSSCRACLRSRPASRCRSAAISYDNVHLQMNLGQRRTTERLFRDRSRHVLQRPQDGDQREPRADERRIAAVARAGVSAQLVDLAEGSFTNQLIGSRVTYTMTPMMFTSALLQYNSSSHAVSANVRLRWEIPSRQRALRRLQRGPRHARPPLPRSGEPGTHRQDQPLVSALNLSVDDDVASETQRHREKTGFSESLCVSAACHQ